jgi:hypothetical protein
MKHLRVIFEVVPDLVWLHWARLQLHSAMMFSDSAKEIADAANGIAVVDWFISERRGMLRGHDAAPRPDWLQDWVAQAQTRYRWREAHRGQA